MNTNQLQERLQQIAQQIGAYAISVNIYTDFGGRISATVYCKNNVHFTAYGLTLKHAVDSAIKAARAARAIT